MHTGTGERNIIFFLLEHLKVRINIDQYHFLVHALFGNEIPVSSDVLFDLINYTYLDSKVIQNKLDELTSLFREELTPAKLLLLIILSFRQDVANENLKILILLINNLDPEIIKKAQKLSPFEEYVRIIKEAKEVKVEITAPAKTASNKKREQPANTKTVARDETEPESDTAALSPPARDRARQTGRVVDKKTGAVLDPKSASSEGPDSNGKPVEKLPKANRRRSGTVKPAQAVSSVASVNHTAVRGEGVESAKEKASSESVRATSGSSRENLLKPVQTVVRGAWKAVRIPENRYICYAATAIVVIALSFVFIGPIRSGKKDAEAAAESKPPAKTEEQVRVLAMEGAESASVYAEITENGSDGEKGPDELHYTIRKGDTLSHIAKKFYNDPNSYNSIAAVNSIPDPDVIYPDQEITIPAHNWR
jgi:nucleoid-associated protein YgaU